MLALQVVLASVCVGTLLSWIVMHYPDPFVWVMGLVIVWGLLLSFGSHGAPPPAPTRWDGYGDEDDYQRYVDWAEDEPHD